MKLGLYILMVISLNVQADVQSNGRWIIELNSADAATSALDLDQMIQTHCQGIQVKSLKPMGLENHYVLVAHASKQDIKCLQEVGQIKRIEVDSIMRAQGTQKLNQPGF